MGMITSCRVEDWQTYRALRLQALQDSPDAFGSTYAEEVARGDAAWRAKLETALAGDQNAIWLAWMGAQPCGLVWCQRSAQQPDLASLFQMWVAPVARGQGLGRALLDAAAAWAAQPSPSRLMLQVTQAGSAAMRLYRRYGFVAQPGLAPLRAGSRWQLRTLILPLPGRD